MINTERAGRIFAVFFAGILIMGGAVRLLSDSGHRYNFSYHFQGSTYGTILLIIPFRVYYESQASVDFKATMRKDGVLEFKLNQIPETGYMMRTSGFLGRTLVALTADHDLKKGLESAKDKLKSFHHPYYSRYIKRKKPFLFKICRDKVQALNFRRSRNGIHSHCYLDLTVRFQHYPEVLNIDFNIYEILKEMLGAYNHGYMPQGGLVSVVADTSRSWESPQLDFTPLINRTVVLAARIMGKIKAFKQESPFRLRYRISRLTNSRIEILGEATPNVSIWEKYNITRVSRRVIVRRKDNLLLEDTMSLRIENARGNGLKARTTLKLIR